MKKIFQCTAVTAALFLQTAILHAQSKIAAVADSANPQQQGKNLIRTANDLKSGNWQDVLSSFLQLSATDLTGNNKALNFKSTLLALKLKADSTLLIDTNYVKQKFARNFQFNFSLNLDSNYKFTGFQGGFTWAIINKRDSSVMSLARMAVDQYYDTTQDYLQKGFIAFEQSMTDPSGHIFPDSMAVFKQTKDSLDSALARGGFVRIKSLPPRLQPFMNKAYDQHLVIADSLFNVALAKMRKKPLLTLSASSVFKNDRQAFDNGMAQLIFLQGFQSKTTSTELDVRASIYDGDTLVSSAKQRRAYAAASLGVNFSLFRGKSQKSVFELKPFLAYQNILTTLLGTEKKSSFSANADLRLRITDNLWVPLTITYDFNKKSFLGFLNVAFNFGAFKKSL